MTIFEGGVKVNVVPSEARAFINYRIHPAQTIDSVVEYLRDVIDDDRVVIKVVESFVPSKITGYANDAMPFQVVVNSALEVTFCFVCPGKKANLGLLGFSLISSPKGRLGSLGYCASNTNVNFLNVITK